ncbi:MAG: hypothetical protein QXH95_03070 [Thermoplasmata archaeon]
MRFIVAVPPLALIFDKILAGGTPGFGGSATSSMGLRKFIALSRR